MAEFASEVGKTLEDFFGKVSDMSDIANQHTNASLPAYVKGSSINSRVFIEDAIAAEPVMADLLSSVHSLYVSYILVALQLGQFVSKFRTVRDILSTVATESLIEAEDQFCDIYAALEALAPEEEKKEEKQPKNEKNNTIQSTKADKVSAKDLPPLPSGRLITISMTNPENGNKVADVDVLVQLTPYMIPEEVADAFITLDVTPTIRQRWLQFKAKEISFVSDFLFQADLIKKRRQAMKKDVNRVLMTLVGEHNKANMKRGRNITKIMAGKDGISRNIFNMVMVFSKPTFEKAMSDIGFDFNNPQDRANYFAQSMAMMIAVVDPMYNTVSLYINGIDKAGTYTYKQFERSGSGSNASALQTIAALQQGSLPRF